MTNITMLLVLSVVIIIINSYSIKHSVAMWKYEKNKLGAIGALLMALLGTILPIIILYIRN